MASPNVDTVIVFTPNHVELADFYRQALELDEPQAFGPGHLGFQLGPLYLGFDRVDNDRLSDAVTLWFRVDDIEATFRRCLQFGATARYEPEEKPFGDTVAALIDPHGNHFGLSQRAET